MINIILQSALFGLTMTFGVYLLMSALNRRTGSPLLNPVLLTIIAIVAVLLVFDIPLQDYLNGASIITMMLTPTTALLAYSIYRQLPLLKKYFLPIVLGCLAGSAASMTSVYLLCRLMGLSDTLTYTMIPKSVTTPIAMELSAQGGGVPAFTVAAVIFTGILGAITAPLLVKLLRVKEPVEKGVAIGTCSHAIGTTKAMEMGELEGAMSGISIGVAGIATVIICLFL